LNHIGILTGRDTRKHPRRPFVGQTTAGYRGAAKAGADTNRHPSVVESGCDSPE
jgi:hypothetical protein